MNRRHLLALLAALSLGLAACDSEKIVELTPGEATEADVRNKMGPPDDVWEDDNGIRVLEFTRQPEGTRNWQARIGADGKLIHFKQVLTVANMDKVQAGMSELEVRRLIGKPGRVKPYPLQKQTAWEYRYADGASQPGSFTITFDENKKVVSTVKGPDAKEMKAGA